MNYKWIDILCSLLIIIIVICLVSLIVGDNELFGSSIDYVSQHSVFPDYLRDLFYETGDLFPDFMPHIGSGQNIYNISYYGLYNPVILISYLFPFTSMIDYLVIVSILSVIVSGILFYFFLKKNDFSVLLSFIGSFLLVAAGPILFHSHRHLMFVNYLPFLILGMFGVDRYLKEGKFGLLIFSLVMIIYSSFYYSVGCFSMLFVYMIYKYFIMNSNVKIFDSVKYLVKALIPYIFSILIGALILIPSFDVILSGRDSNGSSILFTDLFLPVNGLENSAYSMGLSVVTLIGLFYLIFKSQVIDKILAIFILLLSFIPVFNFILNGFLYIDFKSTIPFVPLALLLTVIFLDKIMKNKYIKYVGVIIIIFISLNDVFIVNKKDSLIIKDKYYDNVDIVEEVSSYLNSIDDGYFKVNYLFNSSDNTNVSNGVYRSTIYSSTQNLDYKNFYYNILENDKLARNEFVITSTNSIISQIYLSEKYIVSDDFLGSNYKLINTIDNYNIYENINVLPLGYATNNYINIDDYNKLDYQDKMVNLIGNFIGDSDTNVDVRKLEARDFVFQNNQNIIIDNSNNKYDMTVLEDTTLEIIVNDDDYKILSFNITPQDKDLVVFAGGVGNKLTNSNWKYYNNNERFTYVLDEDHLINLDFKKGKYSLSEFEIFSVSDDCFENSVISLDVDMSKTKGDLIVGNIELSEYSGVVLNIPYDDNFVIKANDVIIDYKKINGAFIGFYLEQGKYEIVIEYKNDIKDVSLFITFVSLCILCYKTNQKRLYKL